MKSIVIILLLSVSGVERIELKTHGLNCNEIADAWMEVNTTYHGPGPNQGWVLNDSNLQVGGWYCKPILNDEVGE